MLEVIDYYNVNKSSVCSLQLDASKAFDRVNYCKLFAELLKRNICPLLLRLLLFMYTRQSLRVKWGNTVSSEFTVSNGVKQGGVLSPILFAIYDYDYDYDYEITLFEHKQNQHIHIIIVQ